jgi:hypothetical protein
VRFSLCCELLLPYRLLSSSRNQVSCHSTAHPTDTNIYSNTNNIINSSSQPKSFVCMYPKPCLYSPKNNAMRKHTITLRSCCKREEKLRGVAVLAAVCHAEHASSVMTQL